jgi:hypothetical protein
MNIVLNVLAQILINVPNVHLYRSLCSVQTFFCVVISAVWDIILMKGKGFAWCVKLTANRVLFPLFFIILRAYKIARWALRKARAKYVLKVTII